METWLNDKHMQWKDCTILDKDGLSLSTADRVRRKGGGLALIHKTAYNTKLLDKGIRPTFEHATWELKTKKVTLAIHGIYHPPPSLANKTTNSLFIEDFTDFVSTTLPSHSNNIYIGDFNLHISEEETDPIIIQWLNRSNGTIPTCELPNTQIRKYTGLSLKWHTAIHFSHDNSTWTISQWP